MSFIERKYDRRKVVWTASATSDEVNVSGFAGGHLWVPSTFAGATVTIEAYVNTAAAWHAVNGVSITITAGEIHELITSNLFGLDRIRFVSASSETLNGELLLAT